LNSLKVIKQLTKSAIRDSSVNIVWDIDIGKITSGEKNNTIAGG